ncbi:MAG TPA: carbon-nitrogen hydrolase family protein [Caulobacteraceae bacterium]|nr:carbon-nitrogen hydrolase family protein [Caulobacteraceae bacterium]
MTLRVALVQTRTPATQAAALAEIEPLIRQAASQGAELILTPEGSNLLQRSRAEIAKVLQPPETDPFVVAVRALATELKVWILIGSALVAKGEGKAANRAMLIASDGQVVQTYDKVHMFDVDLPSGERYRESSLYEPGEAARLAQTPWGLLGLTICYDMRFPHLYRALAKAGASIIAVPAAFTRPTGEAHWEVLLRARAIENGVFVLAPAQGGRHEDGRATWGHSIAIDPWGRVLAEIKGDEPGVVVVDLDLDAVAQTRQAIPSLANERAFAAPPEAAS